MCPAAQAGHRLFSEPLGKEAISAGSPQLQTHLRLGTSALEAGDRSSLQSWPLDFKDPNTLQKIEVFPLNTIKAQSKSLKVL